MGVDSFHRLITPSTACGRGTRSARPRGLGGDFEFTALKGRNKVAPFRLGCSASLSRPQGALGFDPPLNPLGTPYPPLKRAGLRPCTRGIKTILRGYEPPPFRKIDFYTSYASYASCASCASCVRCVCQKKKDIRRKSNGVRTPSTACGRSPSLEEGGLRRGKIESLQNVGGRAKGHRGDRKAPISNRRQGRKALTGETPQDLPLRGRGTVRRR